MDVALSETQKLVRDSIREYLEREVPFDRVRQVEASRGMDEKLYAELAGLGWLGLPFAAEHGGQGGELTDTGVLIEELTRRAVLVPIVETLAAGITLQRYGPAELAREIVPQIIQGKVIISPAVLEASDRFDQIGMQVAADGTVSGEKYFVDYGQFATHHLVAAQASGETGLYLVSRDSPRVTTRPVTNIGKIPQAIATYDRAPATHVCGAEGFTFLVRLARAFAGVQCVACSQQALDMTVEYVSMRVQFGRPIGTFQAVQHHCANMATHTLASRFLVYEALFKLDQGTASDTQVAIAKTEASRAASEVTMMAHQLHGGIGFVTEYDLHFFSLRGKQAALSWGSAEECLRIVADTLEEPNQWL
jgi:alkylation response protein AidB-like acyl-CoA dehydrogenase